MTDDIDVCKRIFCESREFFVNRIQENRRWYGVNCTEQRNECLKLYTQTLTLK